MGGLLKDISYGLRILTGNPGFSLIALITLALGIGANAAIFSVVDAVLLRPLPYDEPDRLVRIRETKLPQFPEFSVSPGNFTDWKKQNTVFERLAAWSGTGFTLIGAGDPKVLSAMQVSDGFFAMLGVRPLIGRDFLPEEDQPGHSNVVILSYGLWQQKFGGDPKIVNHPITFSDQSYTVVGVMPATFKYEDESIDLWTPMAFTSEQAQRHSGHNLQATGRLKPGVTLAQARAEMSMIAGRLAAQYPEDTGWDVKLTPLLEFIVKNVRVELLLLLCTVACVLLIACANVANLLLARASGRQREIAIRSSLGAGRRRIVRQLLTESVLLSLIGGVAGLLLALWCVPLLVSLAPQDLPRMKEVTLDARVLAYTAVVTLGTGLCFGLLPALQASKPNLNEMLKDAGRSSTESGRRRFVRSVLVVLEVALSLVLLIGAGLVIKNFIRLQRVDPGFNPDNTLTASLGLPMRKYPDENRQTAFFKQLLDRVTALPGVTAAGTSSAVPFISDSFIDGLAIEGRPPYPSGEEPPTDYSSVSPDYFRAMGIPLLRGRFFTERDLRETTRVAIINEAIEKKFFPGEDPIGKRIIIGRRVPAEIVGIVGDVKQDLEKDTTLQTYEPYTQDTFGYATLVVRTASDPASLAAAIRREVAQIDKEQPIFGVRMLNRLVSDSIARERFSALVLGILSAVALALAAIGIYGVVNYSVTQRTHEIGIRMALGASRRAVIGLVLRQAMLLVLIGVALGLGAAIALTRVISKLLLGQMLSGVGPTDHLTLGSIVLLIITVALLACLIPARRASKVDPLVALRYE